MIACYTVDPDVICMVSLGDGGFNTKISPRSFLQTCNLPIGRRQSEKILS